MEVLNMSRKYDKQFLIPFPVVCLTEDLIHWVAGRHNGKRFGELIGLLVLEKHGFEEFVIHSFVESICIGGT